MNTPCPVTHKPRIGRSTADASSATAGRHHRRRSANGNVDDVTPQRVRFFSDPDYPIWQGRYSPDGRWILFNAQDLKQAASRSSASCRLPAASGAAHGARLWADKARWAPDGKAIYFISNRDSAFFDVWGIAFDP